MNLKISSLKELKLNYKKNGYIKIKLFKKSKIEKFKSNLAKVLLLQIKKVLPKKYLYFKKKKIDFILNEGMISLENADHQNLVTIYNHVNKTNFFLDISNDKNLIKTISYLLSDNLYHPIHFNSDALRIDISKDKKFLYGWHRDSKFNLFNSKFVQLWMPIVNNINNKNKIGGLEIIENSHKLDLDTHDNESVKNRKKNSLIRTPINTKIIINGKKKLIQKTLYASLGEIILFSNNLMHRSCVNSSKNKIRYVLNTFYHDMTNEEAIFENIDQRTSNWKKFFKKKN
jgi:hypothetical protein